MNVRVLVAMPASDEVLFFQEVLEDIQTGRHWRGWVGIQVLMAMTLQDAIDILSSEPVDAVVLRLELCGGRPTEGFLRLQAAAPNAPVILISDQENSEEAVRLLREGAQDFLNPRSLDAMPFAHAIGSAIERQRLVSGARAGCRDDSFTGLPNRTAFLAAADRDRRLAEKLRCRWMLIIGEPEKLSGCIQGLDGQESFTAERRDLLLIETAERMRRFTGPTDLLARIGDLRFGLGTFDTPTETVEAAWTRIHSSAQENRITVGAAIFDFAHPSSLEALIEQAEMDLTPKAMAVRT